MAQKKGLKWRCMDRNTWCDLGKGGKGKRYKQSGAQHFKAVRRLGQVPPGTLSPLGRDTELHAEHLLLLTPLRESPAHPPGNTRGVLHSTPPYCPASSRVPRSHSSQAWQDFVHDRAQNSRRVSRCRFKDKQVTASLCSSVPNFKI